MRLLLLTYLLNEQVHVAGHKSPRLYICMLRFLLLQKLIYRSILDDGTHTSTHAIKIRGQGVQICTHRTN